ncbi:unnamed protein product [Ceratitis capitata]|uniref:(Mediterranean fruit fly) hypothetical protein n=1 Tax=Ceratitis capitata TaxID=7213 RepID=A0A811V5G2_CERCA|nr:unnamed protein product [Ceratitis capitata]
MQTKTNTISEAASKPATRSSRSFINKQRNSTATQFRFPYGITKRQQHYEKLQGFKDESTLHVARMQGRRHDDGDENNGVGVAPSLRHFKPGYVKVYSQVLVQGSKLAKPSNQHTHLNTCVQTAACNHHPPSEFGYSVVATAFATTKANRRRNQATMPTMAPTYIQIEVETALSSLFIY